MRATILASRYDKDGWKERKVKHFVLWLRQFREQVGAEYRTLDESLAYRFMGSNSYRSWTNAIPAQMCLRLPISVQVIRRIG